MKNKVIKAITKWKCFSEIPHSIYVKTSFYFFIASLCFFLLWLCYIFFVPECVFEKIKLFFDSDFSKLWFETSRSWLDLSQLITILIVGSQFVYQLISQRPNPSIYPNNVVYRILAYILCVASLTVIANFYLSFMVYTAYFTIVINIYVLTVIYIKGLFNDINETEIDNECKGIVKQIESTKSTTKRLFEKIYGLTAYYSEAYAYTGKIEDSHTKGASKLQIALHENYKNNIRYDFYFFCYHGTLWFLMGWFKSSKLNSRQKERVLCDFVENIDKWFLPQLKKTHDQKPQYMYECAIIALWEFIAEEYYMELERFISFFFDIQYRPQLSRFPNLLMRQRFLLISHYEYIYATRQTVSIPAAVSAQFRIAQGKHVDKDILCLQWYLLSRPSTDKYSHIPYNALNALWDDININDRISTRSLWGKLCYLKMHVIKENNNL